MTDYDRSVLKMHIGMAHTGFEVGAAAVPREALIADCRCPAQPRTPRSPSPQEVIVSVSMKPPAARF